jgi:hypothetical protein
MASLRRSKTLSPDGQTARFLYTIIKQLDLKTIDWNEVAGSLDITNGHAARMRFSRFKQHIEGTPTQPRASRSKKDCEKVTKGKRKGVKRALEDEVKAEQGKADLEDGKTDIKKETGMSVKQEQNIQVKQEPDARSELGEPPLIKIKREPSAVETRTRSIAAVATQLTPNSGPVMSFGIPPGLPSASPAAVASRLPSAPPAPPPQPTVSLADLQLLPQMLPPPSEAFASLGSSYVLHTTPSQSSNCVGAATPRTQMESNIEYQLDISFPVVIKNETVDS